jgi:protein disulfide-isomerase
MKNIIFAFLFITISTLNAQDNLVWVTDMRKALDISKKESKPMFLFFTGSDWCGWCIRLQNEVFKTTEFQEWSQKVVLVELDFPRTKPQIESLKTQNQQLSQLFKVGGFPAVVFVQEGMTENGKINLEEIGRTGYVAGGPSVWLNVANNIIPKFKPSAVEKIITPEKVSSPENEIKTPKKKAKKVIKK